MTAIDIDLVKHLLTAWARVVRGDQRGNLGFPKHASFTALRVDGGRRSDDRIARDVDAAIVADEVTAAVEQLIERERVAIVRRYVNGWSFQQIADEIGLASRGAAGDVLKRAQLRLAYLLAGEEAPPARGTRRPARGRESASAGAEQLA